MTTAPPFREKRPEQARVALMREVFVPVRHGAVRIHARLGEEIVRECDAVEFLTLDPVERLRRLEAREAQRRGGR
jgi:hypothetical protein